MTNKKRTAGFILVFSFLFLCRQVSYGQPGSVRDTAYEVLSEDCCGGSVPDTADAMYVAAIYSNPGKGPKSQIIFYRFYCRICCYLLRSRNGKQQPLPEADRVKDPALIRKLHNTLQKQLAYKTKLVNGVKY